MKAIDFVTSFYEGVGVLVKEGLLDIQKVAIFFGALTRTSWEKFMPFVEELRLLYGELMYLSEFEYLYNELMKYMKEHPELES